MLNGMDNSLQVVNLRGATAQPRNRATAQPRNRATAQPRNRATAQ
jgi:hypothetical protein